jgi:hypothetical protein
VAPVRDHLDDVAREQHPPLGPEEHLRAGKVTAQPEQADARCDLEPLACPWLDGIIGPHHPLAVVLVDQDRAVELVRPLDHRGVVVRMGDCDRMEAATLPHRGDDLVVDQRLAVPEDVAVLGGHQQRALGDREVGLATDPEQPGQLVADPRPMRGAQLVESCPLLTVERDVLARVLTDQAGRWGLFGSRELRPAGHAHVVMHGDEVNLARWPIFR